MRVKGIGSHGTPPELWCLGFIPLTKYAGLSGFLGGATIHGLHGLDALRPNLTTGLPFGMYLKATIPQTAGQIMTLPSSDHP